MKNIKLITPLILAGGSGTRYGLFQEKKNQNNFWKYLIHIHYYNLQH